MTVKAIRNIVLLIIMFVLQAACTTETVSSGIDRKRVADLNAELGLGYLKQGKSKYKLAKSKLDKALKFDPENVRALHYMGELHRRLQDYDKAEEYFKQASKLAPDDVLISNNYGVYLCDTKKYDQAIELFNKILKDPLYDNKASIYENIGLCRLWQGRITQAESAFRQGLALDPKQPTSLIELAQIRYDAGNKREAYTFYSRYISIALHTPESLWLGILLENDRGAKNIVASYKVKLKGRFPDSKQAKLLEKLEAQGKI